MYWFLSNKASTCFSAADPKLKPYELAESYIYNLSLFWALLAPAEGHFGRREVQVDIRGLPRINRKGICCCCEYIRETLFSAPFKSPDWHIFLHCSSIKWSYVKESAKGRFIVWIDLLKVFVICLKKTKGSQTITSSLKEEQLINVLQ